MSDRIAFSAIIQELADRTAKSPEQCQRFVEELTELLTNEILENEKATVTNFGSFSKVEVSEREGVNPANGQPMTIPAHVRIGFSPYKSLEEAVNAPFSHLEPSFIEDEDEENESDSGGSDSHENKEDQEQEGKKDMPVSVEKYRENKLRISREQPKGPWSIIFTVILIAVILFGIWWAFFKADSTTTVIPAEDPQPTVMTQPEQQQPATREDTTLENPAEISEPVQQEVIPPAPQPAEDMAPVSAPEEPQKPTELPDSYTVIGGEWLYDIARNVYGDPDLWTLIYKANTDKMRRPDEIRHGLVLSIPSLEGKPGDLTKNDSVELSQAYFIVAEAYQNLNEDEKAASYRRYSSRYAQN